MFFLLFFFFKQKTAYEMRISDWSSDVCSSDLQPARTISLNNMYVRDVTPMDIGDDKKRARVWDELDVRPTARAPTSARRRTVSWNAAELVQAGVSGFALWWEAEQIGRDHV